MPALGVHVRSRPYPWFDLWRRFWPSTDGDCVHAGVIPVLLSSPRCHMCHEALPLPTDSGGPATFTHTNPPLPTHTQPSAEVHIEVSSWLWRPSCGSDSDWFSTPLVQNLTLSKSTSSRSVVTRAAFCVDQRRSSPPSHVDSTAWYCGDSA